MRRKQQGFTLLELLFVFGMLAVLAVTEMQSKSAQIEQARARQLGIHLYQYNNAVRSFIAENPGATGTKTGTSWLKPASCGGTAPEEFLSCAFPEKLPLGGLTLSTVLTSTADGQTTGVTTLPALEISGKMRPDLAGLAALTASGGAINNILPTLAATDASFTSDPLTAVITARASNRAETDVWLRTDGGNSMHANINFDSGDASLRNITGVNRVTSVANSVLTLGDASINSRVLLNADTEVLGNLTARSNATIQGNLTTQGNIAGQGVLNIRGDMTGQSNLNVAGSATIGGNISGQNILARGSLTTNGALQVNGGGAVAGDMTIGRNGTVGNNLTVNNHLHAGGMSTGNLQANGTVTVGNYVHAQRFYDANNAGFWVDPNADSNLNLVHTDYTSARRILLKENVAEGAGGCATKEIGTTAAGELLSCVSGVWTKSGKQVKVASGWTQTNAIVNPISGFTRDQCVIGLNGRPHKLDGGYKRARHFDYWSEPAGSGWRVYAGARHIQSNMLDIVLSGEIQYQLTCTK